MPRKRELTWQPGSANREGRWRRKYKGRSIYLCSARSKSDHEGYQRALAIWRRKKLEIDAEERDGVTFSEVLEHYLAKALNSGRGRTRGSRTRKPK